VAQLSQCQSYSNCNPSHLLTLRDAPSLEKSFCCSLRCVTLLGQMHSVCAVVTVLVLVCRSLLCNLFMCYACRIALCFGWLCFLDVSVLFWPIAHNSFLHQLTGVPYPVLIRFHRYQDTLQVPCHPAHLLTHNIATLLHRLFIHETLVA